MGRRRLAAGGQQLRTGNRGLAWQQEALKRGEGEEGQLVAAPNSAVGQGPLTQGRARLCPATLLAKFLFMCGHPLKTGISSFTWMMTGRASKAPGLWKARCL